MTQTCKAKKTETKCKIKGTLSIQNMGTQAATTSFVRYYLSTDSTYDAQDTFLKQVATGKVKVGKPKRKELSHSFSSGQSASGQYVIAVIDADNAITESNETNNNISYYFEGEAPPTDTTPPTVTSIHPAGNATGVSVSTTISATFSEAMDSSTITTSTFTVSGVTGTVTYSGNTATFTPSGNLAYNTTYTAIITTGVRDLAGNALAADYTWTFTTGLQGSGELIQPQDFQYLGVFRLPGGFVRPTTFAYGGNAMTFNPEGDQSGVSDGFPGSLFITGHDRMLYGELPDGSQFAEVNIPVPVLSKNLDELNVAGFLQEFHDAANGLFVSYDEIVKLGIQYLSIPSTGAKIHIAWGQHFHETPDDQVATHAWISPNLSSPESQGEWYIGNQSLYSVNGYMFEIPTSWADEHTSGRYLATGRQMQGGWSGHGPASVAYCPWIDNRGTPAAPNTHLEETVLLLYAKSTETDDVVSHSLINYQHPDEWEGGAWITTTTGKSAVLFAGNKGTGAKYWYGYINPAGSDIPCVSEAEQHLCRQADGTYCPSEDYSGCAGHTSERGWWSARYDAHFILYNPEDFARVVSGEISSWDPQPYAIVDIDEFLFLNAPESEENALGSGVQRRYRIGAVAYDMNNDLIYVLELFADDIKLVIRVWRVRKRSASVTFMKGGFYAARI